LCIVVQSDATLDERAVLLISVFVVAAGGLLYGQPDGH
jgi:predicted membrane-bound spermidine synthase